MTDAGALHGLADRFEADRPHLRAVAQRILGSPHEAEDAVQEAWVRLSRTDTSDISNLTGWLTTVVSRVCLDMLRSRAARREEPADLPDTAAGEAADPEREALMADAIGPALLLVLDTLTPAERLAFVLHDMFAVPFPEIAEIVGTSPAAARQLASRARRRVQGRAATQASRPDADPPADETGSPPPPSATAPAESHPGAETDPTRSQPPVGDSRPPAQVHPSATVGDSRPATRVHSSAPVAATRRPVTGPGPRELALEGTARDASEPGTRDDASVARDVARRRTVVDAFLAASRSGDFTALLALLDPDVVLRADAAGVRTGAAALVRGANAVAETFSGRARGARLALIDGAPGLVWSMHGKPRVVFTFTIAAETGGAVTAINLLADPETLATLHLEPSP
jgi:RNA polymerase sigma factor (sigma-70 family)